MSVEGNKVRIQFEHAGSGLISLDDSPLSWFEIAGENREIFTRAGGEAFFYIPALNARDDHVTMMTELVRSRSE